MRLEVPHFHWTRTAGKTPLTRARSSARVSTPIPTERAQPVSKKASPKQTLDPPVAKEVRTKRLAIIGDDGRELATFTARNGIVELRIGGTQSGVPCEATIYAGECDDGFFTAGMELWAHGDSVRGCTLTVTGNRVDAHRFG